LGAIQTGALRETGARSTRTDSIHGGTGRHDAAMVAGDDSGAGNLHVVKGSEDVHIGASLFLN
jgi:hypothetical protein